MLIRLIQTHSASILMDPSRALAMLATREMEWHVTIKKRVLGGDYQLTVTGKFGDGIYNYGEYNGNVIVYLGDAASAAEVIAFADL